MSYNLFWALLLPFSLAYFCFPQAENAVSPVPTPEQGYRWGISDCLLFSLAVLAMASAAYGSGFPTPDDAFYGHVMSSMLANPTLPVQGQELLMNTASPYSLHPSYRGVGYEALIALISDGLGASPTFLLYGIAPVLGAVMWCLAAYLFMRAMRSPYPGLAVTVFFLLLLFWGSTLSHAPSGLMVNHWWGKSLLLMLAAPLLFSTVAAYVQMKTIRTWILLFLSVCMVAIWSSTALFMVPMAVAMACVVFLPIKKSNLATLIATTLSLTPILLLFLYSLAVLREAPVGVGDTGFLEVNGEEFGGLSAKIAVLVILLTLPLMARSIRDEKLHSNMLRICLVGVFTVMAPFFIEIIAVVTVLNLLSFRLPAAYPAFLLLGIMASIALTHLCSTPSPSGIVWNRFLVPALVLVLYGTLLATIDLKYAHNLNRKFAKAVYDSILVEALSARELVPQNAYVAAGAQDFVLPILPEPPAFIAVRHYLLYHKNSLSEAEYADRTWLQTVLSNRLPSNGESLDSTMNQIAAIADKLKVTTLIFSAERASFLAAADPEKAKFVAALTEQLTQEKYQCSATPSGSTIVCNK